MSNNNTQLPVEVVNEIQKKADQLYPLIGDVKKKIGFKAGAIEYATKLHQVEKERDEEKRQRVLSVKSLRYSLNQREAEVSKLKGKGDELARKARSLRLSVTAHPDYKGEPNDEWTDLIEGIDEALAEWKGCNETLPPVTQQGAVWVMATDRLPGWYKPTKWRLYGVEMDGQYALAYMTNNYPNSLYGWEWLDESGQSKEGNKEEPDIDELWDEHSALIGDDIDDLTFWAGRTVMKKEDFEKAIEEIKKGKGPVEQKGNPFDYETRETLEKGTPAPPEAIKRMKDRWIAEGKRECPDCGLWFKSEGRCPKCNHMG